MKTVYMCFSTDIIHSGHINIIQKAARLGRVVAGVLCDRCVAIYEKYPLLPEQERVKILENITGIDRVVVQNDIYYDEVIRKLRPDYVVHGDNWRTGYQKPVRARVIETLKEWGGELVEFPYTSNETLATISQSLESRVGMPETRRQWLQYKLKSGELTRVMEAHDGLSALLVERTKVGPPGKEDVYDGLWISSLCDSTVKGKPDTELVDLTARPQTVSQILDVTTKPIVFDMDTGGMLEHFVYNIATIEKAGVSAVIIEDKTGLKRNSLFGTSVEQHQESIDNFCEKIRAGKSVIRSGNFMLIARIESLILKQGLEDAMARATAYVEDTFQTNVLGMRAFLAQALEVKADRFINCSTSEVYSMESYRSGGVREDDYIHLATAEHSQRTSYAAGKLLTEFFLTEPWHSHLTSKPFSIPRRRGKLVTGKRSYA